MYISFSFSLDVLDASKEYLEHGLMSIVSLLLTFTLMYFFPIYQAIYFLQNCSYLRLSDPNGFLISNEIISKLFTKVPVITS